jgi:hypothetical protein
MQLSNIQKWTRNSWSHKSKTAKSFASDTNPQKKNDPKQANFVTNPQHPEFTISGPKILIDA